MRMLRTQLRMVVGYRTSESGDNKDYENLSELQAREAISLAKRMCLRVYYVSARQRPDRIS